MSINPVTTNIGQTPSPVVATYEGVEILAAPHLGPGMISRMQAGRYEGQEVRAALKTLKPGCRILEMGAGSGVVGAIIARNCAPKAMIAVEANPDLIPYINQLYTHNNLCHIISVRQGVVATEDHPPGSKDFHIRGNFLGSGLEVFDDNPRTRKISVPTINYKTLCKEFPHNVLIMDIEGAEKQFFDQADLSAISSIIVELHPNIYGSDGLEACHARLLDAGFSLHSDYNNRSQVRSYQRAS